MITDYLDRMLGVSVTAAWSAPEGGISMTQGTLNDYEHITYPGSDGRKVWLETILTIDGQEFDMIGPYEVMQNNGVTTGQEQM